MRALHGCWWWLGTIGVVLFLIGLILVYPWLFIPTGIVLGILIIVGIADARRSRK